MDTLTQLAVSTEPCQVAITATLNGAPADPTSSPVAFAFVPANSPPPDPASNQFIPGTWETDPGPVYWASVLVGPQNGGTVLAAGSYIAYVRITGNPAVPVRPAFYLTIT